MKPVIKVAIVSCGYVAVLLAVYSYARRTGSILASVVSHYGAFPAILLSPTVHEWFPKWDSEKIVVSLIVLNGVAGFLAFYCLILLYRGALKTT